ncbi:NAD-dependent epimerase/dehydratase family protein [Mucilaginibacter sp. R-33]|uniref:NAD-dependent epimerase/dehydratase family protein n=1 Tax=Mucilaginibacter sp. R-33 TaxID=3416711 RepID=UPI003CEDE0B9
MNKILITGANGQIGTELTVALRERYGSNQVIGSDIKRPVANHDHTFQVLDVLNKTAIQALVQDEGITEIYHLAASLSAVAEKQPLRAWELNMQGLLNVLDTAKIDQLKVFWPSSIAVFGDHAPKAFCSQHTITQPRTVYGISKAAGENWCRYYYDNYGVDVRSIRYPGLISHTAQPGGGTTDYAVEIFHQAIKNRQYTCYLKPHTTLPMMYMADAVRATLELMEAPSLGLTVRTSYNVAAMSFSPGELEAAIRKHLPAFRADYRPDFRQTIADSWPTGINDHQARHDWSWMPRYDLPDMVNDMLVRLRQEKDLR